MNYEVVIGLEVHVHLKTRTKAFCGCSTEFGQKPNSQSCPVCLGFPGSLPVLNRRALEYAIKVALALNCQVQEYTKFDRKNYFYPDLPKNYQISQYDLPLSRDGFLEIHSDAGEKRIVIRRVHLEEDAGKLIHKEEESLVDFNRSGMPLLEIVSEPEIHSPDEAYDYLLALKSLIEYLGVSDCDMEKGTLRCDANISLRRPGAKELGVKAELKNMNSFKAVREALAFEIKRQSQLLDKSKAVTQETRLWDAKELQTLSMRSKEEAQDYRYFPEPDLSPFIIGRDTIENIRNSLPELPRPRQMRLMNKYGFCAKEAVLITSSKDVADYFEECVSLHPNAKSLFNWISGPIFFEMNERVLGINELGVKPQSLVDLIKFLEDGKISNLVAKDVLTQMIQSKKSAKEIIEEKGLTQISDADSLEEVIAGVLAENAKSVSDYKSGKGNALMFLVGQVMKKSQGKANPKVVQELLKKKLNEATT
jgi:aspartyl-tRNA(Asn)/glutamyl-tRNA(Gln) amidotransferase subunit B